MKKMLSLLSAAVVLAAAAVMFCACGEPSVDWFTLSVRVCREDETTLYNISEGAQAIYPLSWEERYVLDLGGAYPGSGDGVVAMPYTADFSFSYDEDVFAVTNAYPETETNAIFYLDILKKEPQDAQLTVTYCDEASLKVTFRLQLGTPNASQIVPA